MSLPTQHVDLENTFKGLYIGITIAAMLFGITNVQVFAYFYSHRKSGATFYALAVIWLWVFDALHLAAIAHAVYHYLVTDFFNISMFRNVVWSFKLHLLLDTIIVFSVHALYLHRIWKAASSGRSRSIPISVGLVMAVGLAFSIAFLSSAYPIHVFTDFFRLRWMTYVNLAVATLMDVLIALSLIYLLSVSRTGFSSIDSFMSKLMAFVINTGALTSFCSLSALIMFAVMPENFIFLSIQILFPKLYVSSFLALLNAQYYTQGTGCCSVNTNAADLEIQRRTSKLRTIQSTWVDSLCTLPGDDVSYPPRPAEIIHKHRGVAVEVQMVTLSD